MFNSQYDPNMRYDMNDARGEAYAGDYGGYAGLTLNQYLTRTFGWMFAGLMITFGLAFSLAQTGLWMAVYSSGLVFVLTIVELVLVLVLASRIQSLPVGAAFGLFFAYSAINGVLFSAYFIAYGYSTLIGAFLVSALYFGALAAYGVLTKRDLSGWGPYLFAGLIAMLIFSVIALFIGQAGSILLSAIGLVIFMCLTAYDAQRIKGFYYATGGDSEMAAKASIYGALQLYLDFINIFLYILRIMSRRSRR